MSDFFAGVNGARFPQVVMNQGPLPGMGGLPAPLHDTADGRINYNSSLLGDVQPYAYGEPGYLSSQNAYLNIPHRIQKIVPYLFLPSPDATDNFKLYHPIDDGDIAFTLRLDRNSEICTGLRNRAVLRSGLGTAIDPMINLCTLNYLLAGLQLCTQAGANDGNLRAKWDDLMHHLDRRYTGNEQQAYTFESLKDLVRNLIRPFGVAHGSEKQGGQHEGGLAAVTWPVSFVISLILDGKDANVVNLWNSMDVEAGNDLVLRLKPMPIPPDGKYTLNHWAKSLMEKTFTQGTLQTVRDCVRRQEPQFVPTHVWQLVPDIFSLEYELSGPAAQAAHAAALQGIPPNFRPAVPFCWQEQGYWHIARAQVHSRRYGLETYYYNDMANNLRTGHMDVTFQPTFYASPYRDMRQPNGQGVATGPARNVHNILGAEWQSKLRLEALEDPEPPRKRPRALMSVSSSLEFVAQGPAQVSEMPLERPAVTWAEPVEWPAPNPLAEPVEWPAATPLPAGLTEDIGTFETYEPKPFAAPKPGLKSKRSSGRGRGVMGAVLAADGSVTHEQSRML